MGKRSKQVDAYIAKAEEFARPILERIRSAFHAGCPGLEETIKWGFPHFEHKGLLGSMAAFKRHVSFGFWKGSLIKDPAGLFKGIGKTSMSAARVRDLASLPSEKVLASYVKEAAALNEKGVKAPARPRTPRGRLKIPDEFMAALRKSKRALATFEAFPPSHRRDYVEWITEAKQEATRERRLATAIEWLAEGKPRNWKYMKR